MTRRLSETLTLAILVVAGVCPAQEPAANHEKLAFLNPLVGNWRVVTTEDGKVVSDGQEDSEWMLNKSAMRHVGWSQYQGDPAQYMFYTGWNPKTERVFQWAVGATDSVYAIMRRTGNYDPATRVWTSEDRSVFSDGDQAKTLVKLRFVDDTKVTIDFLSRRQGSMALPDHHDVFTRAEKAAAPAFDEKPGAGFEHLKFLDSSVGKWKVKGDLPNNGEWVGEEVNAWVFDKNFMLTKGWCIFPESDGRIEYELLTAWDPAKEKIVTMALTSSGWSATREGTYDPQNCRLSAKQTGIHSWGTEVSADVETLFLAKDRTAIKFTNRIDDGESLPDFQLDVTKIRP